MKKYVFILSLVFSFAITTTVVAAQENSEKKTRNFAPSVTVTAKDSVQIYQFVQNNNWFKEFRQSPLYMGLLYKMAPALFSLSDEYGDKAGSWKGRLIDHVYENVLNKKSISLDYYQQSQISSPYVITVLDLSKTELNIVEAMIKMFKYTEDQEVEVNFQKKKISAIEVKGQKLAIRIEGKCVSIGRDPKTVIASNLKCPVLPKNDLVMTVNLSQMMSSLTTIRESFVGVKENIVFNYKWNSKDFRFDPMDAQTQLTKNHIISSKKVSEDFLKLIPQNSDFYALGNIPTWDGSLNIKNIKKYLSSDRKALKNKNSITVALIHVPVRELNKVEFHTNVLIETGALTQAKIDEIVELYSTRFGEVYVRPMCKKAVLISRSKAAVAYFQDTCERKVPSMGEVNESLGPVIVKSNASGGIYFSLGQLLSNQMALGYYQKNHTKFNQKNDSKKKGEKSEIKVMPLPAEIIESQKLVEKLPAYFFSGIANDTQLIMKSVN